VKVISVEHGFCDFCHETKMIADGIVEDRTQAFISICEPCALAAVRAIRGAS
jgi:hypothetical protein